jgi:hypothetical protein
MALARRAMQELRDVATGATETHRHLRDRIVVALVASVAVDVVCSVLALVAERGAKGADVHSLGTAAFWATSQLLTVSSSMTDPVTTGGRVLDVFMEIYAITVVTAMAGSFGAFFHRRSQERSAQGAQ